MAQLSAQGMVLHLWPTSETRTSGDAGITSSQVPVGQRARDTDGNEYMLVKFTTANYYGGWALIRGTNATRVANDSVGPLGVCQANAAANDYGWVKIYGTESVAQIKDSEATSAYGLLAPAGASTEPSLSVTSSLRTSVVSGPMDNPVRGAHILSAADTATTAVSSAQSGITVSVFLNYPELSGLTLERAGTT